MKFEFVLVFRNGGLRLCTPEQDFSNTKSTFDNQGASLYFEAKSNTFIKICKLQKDGPLPLYQ